MKLRLSLLFHLNLSYSAIEVAERADVVRDCYWPLLRLLDGRPWLRLCVEATAHTLERLEELDPVWVARLREGIDAGRIELVGSGDTQLIGPLVPAEVNRWNQALGAEGYERRLGVRPETALVGEMAWSQGLVDAYVEAGYRTLLMEWNNPRRSHPEWPAELRFGLARTASPTGAEVDLLFVDAIAFQKFQRVATGDLEVEPYCDWVLAQEGAGERHLFLYASDGEVFDRRPGRFHAEPPLENGSVSEWTRIGGVLDALHARGARFTTPGAFARAQAERPRERVELTSFATPIPVKKQPKYNVTRWALTGRDDVALNSACFARARELGRARSEDPADWRELCRAWQSDHRTHLTTARWRALRPLGTDPSPPGEPAALTVAEAERDGRTLRVRTDGIALELDCVRGLAITALGTADGPELVRTLPHGYFDDIHWAADFYSGHFVAEVPAHLRATDLAAVEPEVAVGEHGVEVSATVETALGTLAKTIVVERDRVRVRFGLAALGKRPVGSVRCAFVTLDPERFGGEDVTLRCAQGGAEERFRADSECDHWSAVSALISAGGAFGATEGRLAVENGEHGLELEWDPGAAAALPLVLRRRIDGRTLLRIAFSLSEIDDTHREGAPLRDFELALVPRGGAR